MEVDIDVELVDMVVVVDECGGGIGEMVWWLYLWVMLFVIVFGFFV